MQNNNHHPAHQPVNADAEIDICKEKCPMTFVKTKLAIERINPGQILKVRLTGAEPLHNVPASLTDHGHKVLSLTPENAGRDQSTDIHILFVQKV